MVGHHSLTIQKLCMTISNFLQPIIYILNVMIQHDNVSLFYKIIYFVRDPLLGLRQFLAAGSPLKWLKNRFLKKLFTFLRYLSFCPGHVGKRLDKKAKVNFETYDVTD